MELMDIISYTKASIEILMNLKNENLERSQQHQHSLSTATLQRPISQLDSLNNSPDSIGKGCDYTATLKEYEAMMQKYEGDVRNHIRIEQ